MARQITILETKKVGDGKIIINGVFWFQIANVLAQIPRPQYVSALVSVSGPTAITPAEQASLESGAIREESFNIEEASSTNLTQAKTDLIRRFTDRNAAVQAEPATRQFYGLTYDGATWSS